MPEFFNVLPPEAALQTLRRHVSPKIAVESVLIGEALGRYLAHDVHAETDLPTFARSSMDGYSVRARDTFGATESLPAYLTVVGDVPTGARPSMTLSVGEAAGAHTGGMLALGADAVVMVEQTQTVDQRTIEVVRAVAPGESVIQVGEDVRADEVVLPKGHRLRPQDLGGLTAVGVTSVAVAKRPRVGILSTGDEVVSPDRQPLEGQVRDINS